MPGSDYWKKRFELLEDAMNNKGAQYMKDSEAIYRKAISNTEKEISRWYARFADNEGISYQRAVEMLTGDELKEFHMDVKEYIETKERMLADYEDELSWERKALVNIAKAGFFSSDRTIREYNDDIWRL